LNIEANASLKIFGAPLTTSFNVNTSIKNGRTKIDKLETLK
jgi:hypothetical protein